MQLSSEDRRALALILGLLFLAAGARWVERPRPLLEDAPSLDLAQLEAASRSARDAESAPAGRLDPNTASVQELDRLPGVGPAMAQRIVEERQREKFAAAGDLERVRGIGPALAAKLAEHVTLPAGRSRTVGDDVTAVNTAGDRSSSQGRSTVVDLNRATADELDALPGIGPAMAQRLVARRDSLGGRFRDWTDVDAVRGVGPALLAKLQQRAVLR
jgi:competence protein ComEA